jgi:tetratricopeptide (TPR) repeat protein
MPVLLAPLLVLALYFVIIRSGAMRRIYRKGTAALTRGDHATAGAAFTESLALARRRFGHRHWRVAFHLSALGSALRGLSRGAEAEKAFEEALALIDDRGPRLPDARLAFVFLAAANDADLRGDRARFEALLDRANQGRPSKRVLALSERARVTAAMRRGDWPEAARVASRIPDARLKAKDVVRWISQIGLQNLRAGDFALAASTLRVAFECAQRHSPRSVAPAFYQSLLGEALASGGNPVEALASLESALAGYERFAGTEHVATARVLLQVADARARLGDVAGARLACERVLGVCAARRAVGSAESYRTAAPMQEPMAQEFARAQEIRSAMSAPPDT